MAHLSLSQEQGLGSEGQAATRRAQARRVRYARAQPAFADRHDERVDVEAGLVRVRAIDLLDETPILDIKPYLPMTDSWPQAGHGWLEPYLRAGVEPRLKKPYRPPRARTD